MQIVFLGTSSMVPTKERNHSSIYFNFKGEGFLFDCGEGTQRQIKIAGVKPSSIDNLIISHWHGDHVLGIPGLLQTLAHNNYDKTLKIFGPSGTRRFMSKIFSFFSTVCDIKCEVFEVKDGEAFIDEEEYSLTSHKLDHGIECMGYAFKEKDRRRINKEFIKEKRIDEGPHLKRLQKGQDIIWKEEKINHRQATYNVKGKKVGFIFDTKVCKNCYKIADDADVLISEATFTDEHQENAKNYKHMTAKDVGEIAVSSKTKKVILTHFSQRYRQPEEILKEVKSVFKNTEAAYDLMKIIV
ncbi:MAG: ribonuclease Z [Candidatus Woesearchaeota archaeon]